MTDVVYSKKVHNQTIPVALFHFIRDMPCHIIINFCKVLSQAILVSTMVTMRPREALTETKKLVVPSAREKVLGNSFNQVSSPYIKRCPLALDCNCETQVS